MMTFWGLLFLLLIAFPLALSAAIGLTENGFRDYLASSWLFGLVMLCFTILVLMLAYPAELSRFWWLFAIDAGWVVIKAIWRRIQFGEWL